jgi:hypothetical protein
VEALDAVHRRVALIAGFGQDLATRVPDGLLVIDHQHLQLIGHAPSLGDNGLRFRIEAV